MSEVFSSIKQKTAEAALWLNEVRRSRIEKSIGDLSIAQLVQAETADIVHPGYVLTEGHHESVGVHELTHEETGESLGMSPIPQEQIAVKDPRTGKFKNLGGLVEIQEHETHRRQTKSPVLNHDQMSARERRISARTKRRQSRVNDIRSNDLYRLREVWGEGSSSDDPQSRAVSARSPRMDRVRASAANRRHERLENRAVNRQERIERQARGEDIRGRRLSKKEQRLRQKLDKLNAKQENLRSKID